MAFPGIVFFLNADFAVVVKVVGSVFTPIAISTNTPIVTLCLPGFAEYISQSLGTVPTYIYLVHRPNMRVWSMWKHTFIANLETIHFI